MKNPATINSAPGRRILPTSIPITAAVAVTFGWLTGATAQDVSNGTLAAAIRANDHPCATVIEKERLSEDPSVWRVRCNSGQFQVTMKGDSEPEVVPLD